MWNTRTVVSECLFLADVLLIVCGEGEGYYNSPCVYVGHCASGFCFGTHQVAGTDNYYTVSVFDSPKIDWIIRVIT